LAPEKSWRFLGPELSDVKVFRSPGAEDSPALLSSVASPLTRAPVGSNPIRASDSIVFPLPDSPTSPTHSPAPISSDTSFTGRTHPCAVGNSTVSPRISSKLLMRSS